MRSTLIIAPLVLAATTIAAPVAAVDYGVIEPLDPQGTAYYYVSPQGRHKNVSLKELQRVADVAAADFKSACKDWGGKGEFHQMNSNWLRSYQAAVKCKKGKKDITSDVVRHMGTGWEEIYPIAN